MYTISICDITPFLAIIVLRDIQVYVYTSNYDNVLAYIETSANKIFGFSTIL